MIKMFLLPVRKLPEARLDKLVDVLWLLEASGKLSRWLFSANMFAGMSFPGVDLAYIQTGISGVFFCVLNFENLYFFGYWSKLLYFFFFWGGGGVCQNKCCIFKYFTYSTVFSGPNLFTRYFSKHISSLLSSRS